MSQFALRLPDDLKEEANRQAEALGISLNQFVVGALASRVGAQAEAGRYFKARAARVQPGTAKAILARVGQGVPPRPDDEI
jgi:hypothetical protein